MTASVTIHYFLLQGWTYEHAELVIRLDTNGTVDDLTFMVWFKNLFHNTDEEFRSDGVEASASPSDPTRVSIHVEKIQIGQPIVIRFLSFSPTEELAFNSTDVVFYRPDVGPVPRNVTEVGLYAAIYAKNRLGMTICLASDWYGGTIQESQVTWAPFSYHKDSVEIAGMILLAIATGTILAVVVGKAYRPLPVPWLTLTFMMLMIACYTFIGTGADFLYQNGCCSASRSLLELSHMLFHSSYNHLAGNLQVFVLSGFLVEYWLRNKSGGIWFVLSLVPSYLMEIVGAMRSMIMGEFLIPSIGASLWVIGQSIVLARYLQLNASKRRDDPKLDLPYILVFGYCLVTITYGYLAPLVLYPGPSTFWPVSLHLLSALLACFLLWDTPHVAYRVGFLRKALADLGIEESSHNRPK